MSGDGCVWAVRHPFHGFVVAVHLPIVVGGDFNLIRYGADRNNNAIY